MTQDEPTAARRGSLHGSGTGPGGPGDDDGVVPLVTMREPSAAFGPGNVRTNLSDMTMFDALRFRIVGLVAGGFDHAFWSVDVLRACQVQPAIWHASLALTALHQSQQRRQTNEQSYRTQRHERLSATHYSAALEHVIALTRRKQLSAAERETLLLVSLLLTALCTMQDDLRQAVMHASNGIQLYGQWRLWERHRTPGRGSSSSNSSLLNRDSIGAIIAHFELQLVNRLKEVSIPPWGGIAGSPPRCSDLPFRSATEAYHEFQPLFTSFIGLWQHAGWPLLNQQLPAADIRHPYVAEFKRWKHKFDVLRASGRVIGSDSAESILTLDFHSHFVQTALTADLTAGEVAFDKFLPVFQGSVRRARDILELICGTSDGKVGGHTSSSSCSSGARPTFSFAVSVVEGLLWGGGGCRDAGTRREFLQLIREWPRREGIWSNELMAAMLETQIAREEMMWRGLRAGEAASCGCVAGAFVCGGHRINNQAVEFLSGGRARVRFDSMEDLRNNGPGYTVVLP